MLIIVRSKTLIALTILGLFFSFGVGGKALAQTMGPAAMGLAPGQPLVVEIRPLRDITLSLEPSTIYTDSDAGDLSYRQQAKAENIALLLYGVTNAPMVTMAPVQPSKTAQPTKNLKEFMDSHFDEIKRDYFNQDDPDATRLVTGDPSFISQTMTEGIAQKPAKLAGFTIPKGDWTVGGGYTWGEENPLLMQAPKKGVIFGARYDGLKVPVQISYMTTGRDLGPVSTGGGDYIYDNVMIGTSIPLKDNKWYVNTTVQYRNDRNKIESDQQQLLFTVGTKIKF
jgi:hypothetical protein